MGTLKEQKVEYVKGICDEILINSHGNTAFCNKNMVEINPTIGCQFQCQYCNAYTQEKDNFFEDVRLFQDYPDYLKNYLEEHKTELDKLFFYFSPKVDMLQECLIESGVTEKILSLLNDYGARYFSVTKGKTPPEKIRKLLIEGRDINQIIISCTMPNERVREILEPGAATISERLEFAKFCKENSIPVTAIFSPILPVEDLEFVKEYIKYYISIGINHFRVDFTEISRDSLDKLISLVPEYEEDFKAVYLDKDAEITKWKVPYKNVMMERYWPSINYMKEKFEMLRDYAKSLDDEATVSVCNSLCVANKLCGFNDEAKKRGYNCIGVRFS